MVPLDNSTAEDLYCRLENVLKHYNRSGVLMKPIHCDGVFLSIMDEVADNLDISMNYGNPDDHVRNIERNNQVVQEIFRIAYYRLHFKKIPRLMVRYLAMIATTN